MLLFAYMTTTKVFVTPEQYLAMYFEREAAQLELSEFDFAVTASDLFG
jgi:hypothetical protein